MTLTFYYCPMTSSNMTEAILAELGVPNVERIKLDISAGDTRKPEFLAINPNGCVPTIVHEGVAIWESAAILMYLGEVFGVEKGLWPPSGPRRGEAMKWVVWSCVTFAKPVARVVTLLRAGAKDTCTLGQGEVGANALEKATEDLAVCLRILDSALEGKRFLLGDDYSLVDTQLLCMVGYQKMLGVDFGPFPNVSAWLERRNERAEMLRLQKEAFPDS